MPSNKDKKELIDAVIKRINGEKSGVLKTDNGPLIRMFGDDPTSVPTISSGSLVLDSCLGGGIPVGRVVVFYGPEASGKTSIALTTVGNVQRNGGKAVYIDQEFAIDPKYATKLGVDMHDLFVATPDFAEQCLELIIELTRSGAFDVIVLDSIAALVPQAEYEGEMDQNTIGLMARILGKALRKLVPIASQTGTTIILINQTRTNIGVMYGNPETLPGGKAIMFFASQVVRISKESKPVLDEQGKPMGNVVKFDVKKNKVAPPYAKGQSILTWNKGIGKADEMLEVGPQYGVIKKPNNRTYLEEDINIPDSEKNVIGTSRAAALERLNQDKELYNRLAAKLSDILKKEIADGEEEPGDDDTFEEMSGDES